MSSNLQSALEQEKREIQKDKEERARVAEKIEADAKKAGEEVRRRGESELKKIDARILQHEQEMQKTQDNLTAELAQMAADKEKE